MISIIVFIPLCKIILSSSIGGSFIFITFGLYYLSSNNAFNSIVLVLFAIYLTYIIHRISLKGKGKNKKFPKLILVFMILFLPQFFILKQDHPKPKISQEQWEFSMRTNFNRTIDLFDTFNATSGYRERQSIYLNDSKDSNHVYAQASRVYLGLNVSEISIEASLYKIYDLRDTLDFTLNNLLRLIYLDINRSILSPYIRNKVIDAFGKTKYWYTEPTRDSMIYYTENHQILFHTAELLIGQLFPNDTFVISNMTGLEHVNHATPLVKRWLDWRAQFGFAEWHSNTYFTEDIAALVNLVDFSEDPEIVYKAAMILDIIAFDFANNYYKGRYATTHGRCYDRTKLGTSVLSPPSQDSTSESAWIMLGIGEHNPNDKSNLAAVALATSDYYAPPPILEDIANNATFYNEHKERNSINMNDGNLYNISYSENDLMFWLGMSAVLPPQTIKQVFNLVEKYNIDSNNVYGPDLISSFFKISAFLHGISLSQYSEKMKLITQGISLETSNTYTYRTPYYQLSGSQDHQKGMNSYQEHIWQASLDDNAFVYTNSPGGLTKDLEQEYVGGWNPRATLYKNVGIIQYDRETLPLEGELLLYFLNLFTGNKFYQHAYFPQWAFDEVEERGKWIFGAKGGGYIALYSFYDSRWVSDYELRVDGFKNLWIVELGSVDEYGSFNQFISDIQHSQLQIVPQALGFNVQYSSPSQGLVRLSWDGPMIVGGSEVDLGPYARFDNDYCYQNFGTKSTLIQFGNQSLVLNFVNTSRIYQIN
ncbi:MAG: hypothetical protein ACFFE5_00815 [Candidatus Thorarchaeota archaeon]